MQFTQQELEVLLILLSRCNITGGEALNVALLIQKIKGLIEGKPPTGSSGIPTPPISPIENKDVKK